MFEPDQYALLDFGQGTKLESFGGLVILRETKSVPREQAVPLDAIRRLSPDLSFHLEHGSNRLGKWTGQPNSEWVVRHRSKQFLLKPTGSGQIGLFPEQAGNWEWIESKCRKLEGLTGINLFGYTGGTTLSLAAQGAAMVHVDAAGSVVRWARENARRSGLGAAPIRWIVEDALKFIRREAKRGNRYDILVADPPSFGTGPKRELWKLSEHLEELLAGLANIAKPEPGMIMISNHTEGYDETILLNLIRRFFALENGNLEALPLSLQTLEGRRLEAGHCVRYVSNQLIR
jgi:23S rRNA (cytosine1962-C5)-methyltransferase